MNAPPLILPVSEAIAVIRLDRIMIMFETMVIKLTLAVLRFLAISRSTSSASERPEMAKRGM